MTPDFAASLLRDALLTAFWVALPMLAIGFAVGIAVSLIQIISSIQDSAFSAVPRLLAFLGALVFLLPWMFSRLMAYSTALFGDLGRFAK